MFKVYPYKNVQVLQSIYFLGKINFPGKMPLKCSNNAQCFCLTNMLEKMLA